MKVLNRLESQWREETHWQENRLRHNTLTSLFQLFHHYLGLATRENNASSHFSCVMVDTLPFSHNAPFIFARQIEPGRQNKARFIGNQTTHGWCYFYFFFFISFFSQLFHGAFRNDFRISRRNEVAFCQFKRPKLSRLLSSTTPPRHQYCVYTSLSYEIQSHHLDHSSLCMFAPSYQRGQLGWQLIPLLANLLPQHQQSYSILKRRKINSRSVLTAVLYVLPANHKPPCKYMETLANVTCTQQILYTPQLPPSTADE